MNGIFLFCTVHVHSERKLECYGVTVYAVFSFPRYFQLSALLLLPKFLLSRLYISFLLQHKSRHGKIRQFNLFSLQKHVMFAIYTTNTPYIIYIYIHTHRNTHSAVTSDCTQLRWHCYSVSKLRSLLPKLTGQ